jgi:hypothetical protein
VPESIEVTFLRFEQPLKVTEMLREIEKLGFRSLTSEEFDLVKKQFPSALPVQDGWDKGLLVAFLKK